MIGRKLLQLWDAWLFRPTPGESLAAFRIAFGAIVLCKCLLLLPDAALWYGPQGPVNLATNQRMNPWPRMTVFALLPEASASAYAVLTGLTAAAGCLIVGYRTRIAAILVWVGVVSLDHRNTFIVNGGDTLMRCLAFYLMFAQSGATWSLDRRRLARRSATPLFPALVSPWPMRLMQCQLCVLYLATVWWKLTGREWSGGTAIYYIVRLDEFQRFAPPAFMLTLGFSRFITWSALAVEAALGTLVWIPRLRYPVLIAGVLLHLGLELTMSLSLFQWTVLSSYLLFVPPDHLRRLFVRPVAASSAETPALKRAA